jgi:hypothetical protein
MSVNKTRDIKGQNRADTPQNTMHCVCIDIGRRGGKCICPDQSAKSAVCTIDMINNKKV